PILNTSGLTRQTPMAIASGWANRPPSRSTRAITSYARRGCSRMAAQTFSTACSMRRAKAGNCAWLLTKSRTRPTPTISRRRLPRWSKPNATVSTIWSMKAPARATNWRVTRSNAPDWAIRRYRKSAAINGRAPQRRRPTARWRIWPGRSSASVCARGRKRLIPFSPANNRLSSLAKGSYPTMLLILFGVPGAGKSFAGHILRDDYGVHFHDADHELPEDMRHALASKLPVTDDMRQRFFERVIRVTRRL